MALASVFNHGAIWELMIITVSKLTHEQLNSKNSEDHEEQENNKQHIKECWDGKKETVNNSLDSLILRHHSERSEGSQRSETSDETDICSGSSLHNPCQDTEHNNDEIKNVPTVLEVSSLSDVEPNNNNLDHHFDHKDDGDDQEKVADCLLLVWVTQLGLVQGQEKGVQGNHVIDEPSEVVVLNEVSQEDPERVSR